MRGRLLLVADEAAFAELRSHSDLRRWLRPARDDHATKTAEGGSPEIPWYPPEALVSDEADEVGEHERNELIHSLLGGTVCYLAVVGAGRQTMPAASSAEARPAAGGELNRHFKWYARFRKELQLRTKARHAHLRHVLILVLLEDLPNDQHAVLDAGLTGSDEERLFDACYVMTKELEPSSSASSPHRPGHEYIAAADVWPVAVDGLLLKLLHDPDDSAKRSSETYAWRWYQLVPQIEAAEQEAWCRTYFERFVTRVMSGASARGPQHDDTGGFVPVAPRVNQVELRPPPDAEESDAPWLEYPARRHLNEVASAQRWRSRLQEAGGKLAEQLNRHVLDDETPARNEATKIWGSVHADPKEIHMALEDPNLSVAPKLDEQFLKITETWKQILAADERRAELITKANEDEAHFTAAQRGFVDLWYRLAAAVSTSLFVGYVSMCVLHFLLGAWGVPAVVACAGALGALIAGVFSYDAEHRAGKRAQRVMVEQCRTIDRQVHQRHQCCQQSVTAAHAFWQQLRAAAAAGRLKSLLRRVQTVLDHELRFRHDPGTFGGAEDERTATGALSDVSGERARLRRARFRDQNCLAQSMRLSDVDGDRLESELQDVVDRNAYEFQHELWLSFCREHDSRQAGHLPASRLVPALRVFRDRLTAEIVRAIRAVAIEHVGEEEPTGWGPKIKDVVHQAYFDLMSCRMLSHHTVDEIDRPRLRLYVRRDFDPGAVASCLDSADLAPITAEHLDHLPLVGFLFQELPVHFERGRDGAVVVGPYPRARAGEAGGAAAATVTVPTPEAADTAKPKTDAPQATQPKRRRPK